MFHRVLSICVCALPYAVVLLDSWVGVILSYTNTKARPGRAMLTAVHLFTSRASGKQRLIILSSFPWTATQPLVTCGGLRSITTPTDMLNVKNFPTRGIPDGRLLAERIAAALCWTRAAPASNQEVNRTEWCCVRQECTSPRCEQVKSRIGC